MKQLETFQKQNHNFIKASAWYSQHTCSTASIKGKNIHKVFLEAKILAKVQQTYCILDEWRVSIYLIRWITTTQRATRLFWLWVILASSFKAQMINVFFSSFFYCLTISGYMWFISDDESVCVRFWNKNQALPMSEKLRMNLNWFWYLNLTEF